MLDSFFKTLSLCFILGAMSACSTAPSASDQPPMIENPFGSFESPQHEGKQNITFRSKRGDQAVEVEIPGDRDDLVVPMNQKFSSASERQNEKYQNTSPDGVDYSYRDQKPTVGDREIASTFSAGNDPETESKKQEIESSLGLQASDEGIKMDESYLSRMDVVKQLFKNGRLEAAMIEVDHLVRDYPTNPRLYEMRGTILDRMGYPDLAIKSWKQAAELNPSGFALKKFIEKREQQRAVRR